MVSFTLNLTTRIMTVKKSKNNILNDKEKEDIKYLLEKKKS